MLAVGAVFGLFLPNLTDVNRFFWMVQVYKYSKQWQYVLLKPACCLVGQKKIMAQGSGNGRWNHLHLSLSHPAKVRVNKNRMYHYQLVVHRMRNKLIMWVQFPLTEANIPKAEPEAELIDTTAGSTWEVKDRALGGNLATFSARRVVPPERGAAYGARHVLPFLCHSSTALYLPPLGKCAQCPVRAPQSCWAQRPPPSRARRDPLPSLGTIHSQENADDPWVSIGIDFSNGLHLPVIIHPLEIIKF